MLDVEGESRAIVLRFKSPDTLKDLIDQLTEHRRDVWSEAEPIQGEQTECPEPPQIQNVTASETDSEGKDSSHG